MPTYDRADWHYGGDYPKDLPQENGGTHIGMFLAWIITRGLESDLHKGEEEGLNALQAVKNRTVTGRDFLFNQCDEKLWPVDLNDEGNGFASWYYESNKEGRPTYFDDYSVVLSDGSNKSIYYFPNSWENFDKVATVLDRRFNEWKSGIPPQPLTKADVSRPWWKFW